MIPGFGGELLSHSFVEHELLPAAASDGPPAGFERQLAYWWRRRARAWCTTLR
jgi:hypothetical protein